MKKASENSKANQPVRQRVRLIDIANRVAVSRRAVSSVLLGTGGERVGVSAETARRIQEVARELGYQPNLAAQQLTGKRSHTFGLLVASAGDPLRSFLVQYLDAESVKVGCHTLIANTIGSEQVGPNQFDYYVNEFYRRGMDGVFCAVHHWFGGDRAALVERHPNTVFYEDPGLPEATYVCVDRAMAVRLAVRHLLEQGRRRIGLAVMSLSRPHHRDRLEGYRQEMVANGISMDPRLVFNAEPLGAAIASYDGELGNWTFPNEIVDATIDNLVRDQNVDAIITHDDYWAAVLIRRLRARGISVPRHVAIVGYLNHYLCDWTDPPLTTIDPSHHAAAEQMVQMLEQMVATGLLPPRERMVKIAPTLIVRQST